MDGLYFTRSLIGFKKMSNNQILCKANFSTFGIIIKMSVGIYSAHSARQLGTKLSIVFTIQITM